MASVVVHVEVRLPSPNRLMREAWQTRASRRKRERQLVREALERAKAAGAAFPPLPVVCTLVRYSANRPDSDQLAMSCKSPRDEVARWYATDDADHRGGITWRYEAGAVREKVQIRAKGRALRNAFRSFLRIRLEPLIERAIGGRDAACATAGQPAVGGLGIHRVRRPPLRARGSDAVHNNERQRARRDAHCVRLVASRQIRCTPGVAHNSQRGRERGPPIPTPFS